jgi:hypothetical protein
MKFIGRTNELLLLEEHYASKRGELFVVYGRRRVGKTEMLAQFCKDKPAIYFTASQVKIEDNLSQFVHLIKQFFNDPALDYVQFPDIEAVLFYLAEKAKQKRLVVVLDEFQYWITNDQSVPSLLQRFWDKVGKTSNLMLILCGSSISMMMDYVLAEKAPLYGRRTGQCELKPFDYRTAGKFFPNWSAKDKLICYGILGGMPAYLAQFDPDLSLAKNIQQKILRKGTFLSEEVDFVLQTELRDVKIYASLLRAIAGGNTTLKDLTSKLNLDARAISTYLSNLQSLYLIRREASMTERAMEKSRKGRYFLQDNFVNFWFRFIEPNITLLEINQGDALFQQIIAPQLDLYMGKIFETICQQFILYYGQEVKLPLVKRIGQVWGKDFDIDVVAENIDGSFTFGECKWSTARIGQQVTQQLLERVSNLPLKAKAEHLVLFSRSGFHAKSSHILVDINHLL